MLSQTCVLHAHLVQIVVEFTVMLPAIAMNQHCTAVGACAKQPPRGNTLSKVTQACAHMVRKG